MKKILTLAGKWLVLSVIMQILLITGLSLGSALFPNQMKTTTAAPELILFRMWLAVAINTAIIMIFILNCPRRRLVLASYVFVLIFGIQFFLSQIETLWFNDSLGLPMNGILTIVFGGFFMAAFFSFIAVFWLRPGKSFSTQKNSILNGSHVTATFWLRIGFLAIFVYPALYIFAGYYIAWQFDAVRELYTGSTAISPLMTQLHDIFSSGLYLFQIPRALLWIAIGLPLIRWMQGNLWQKGIMLGLLFAFLMNAQHLIPNPYMPPEVSLAHFIETASSNFVWGFLVVFLLDPVLNKAHELNKVIVNN